ncbi:MAG: VCBS repeat-containing protein [Deltaproteobacteria bacterium]|nr:VCBS repeat-containing protein [Deltaproteobacteria bacterium]
MQRTGAVSLVFALALAGCVVEAPGEPELGRTRLPLDAYCTITVRGVGTIDLEEDYLPHVVHCENGGADLESLKAQAVAARTYAYYKIETSGSVADGTSDQVYSCGSPPSAEHYEAVRATAGEVLMYRGVVIAGFFVAGANPSNRSTCVARSTDSDPTRTERYVTYNEGLTGTAVHQTSLGWINPANDRNRGCLSQWGSRCLDERGDGYRSILRFYYGADIGIVTAVGSCVGCTPTAEICNGRDDDCDTVIDNGLTRTCGSDVGACRRGTQTCRAGSWGDCVGELGPVPETCNGRDDDCDGVTDEALARTCGSDVGECRSGTQTCRAGSWGDCVGELPPAPEACNDLDDDCDGETDDERVCEVEEVRQLAALGEASSSTDVDGDRRADVCARDANAFACHRATGHGFEVLVLGPALSDAAGWDDPAYGSTLRMGDLDGDGRDDLCARAADGVHCWRSNGGGFDARITGPPLSDAAGWNAPDRYLTLRLADVDGDGRADLCGRDADGLACWPSHGDRFGTPRRLAALSDADGWNDVVRYGTIRVGDVDGDGRDDVCGRAADGMQCWLSGERDFGTRISGPPWSDAAGWDRVEYWSTLRLADVDGDGRADLCARTALDFRCHLSQGDGFGGPVVGPALADAGGWNARGRYATLRLADLDGDGRRDLCARDADGVACWLWTGTSFDRRVFGPALTDADGWAAPSRYRTLRFADVDGDGREDLCARAADGLRCWLAGAAGFATTLRGPAWTDEAGWAAPAYGDTIRLGGPPAGRAPAAADDAPSGCSCSAATTGPDGKAAWLLPALLLALARRRRNCARVLARRGRRAPW